MLTPCSHPPRVVSRLQAEEDPAPRCEFCGSPLRPFPPFEDAFPPPQDLEWVSGGSAWQGFAGERCARGAAPLPSRASALLPSRASAASAAETSTSSSWRSGGAASAPRASPAPPPPPPPPPPSPPTSPTAPRPTGGCRRTGRTRGDGTAGQPRVGLLGERWVSREKRSVEKRKVQQNPLALGSTSSRSAWPRELSLRQGWPGTC